MRRGAYVIRRRTTKQVRIDGNATDGELGSHERSATAPIQKLTALDTGSTTMMHDGMGSMMGWMMGVGLLGWILVIALLVAILVVLVKLLKQGSRAERPGSPPSGAGPGEPRR